MPEQDNDYHSNFEKVLKVWEDRTGETGKSLKHNSPTVSRVRQISSKKTFANSPQVKSSETKDASAKIIKSSEPSNKIKKLATADAQVEGNKNEIKTSHEGTQYTENTDYKEQERAIDTRKFVRAIQRKHAAKEGAQTDFTQSRTEKYTSGYVPGQTAETQPDIQPGKIARKPGEREADDVFHTRINTTADIETRENLTGINSERSQRTAVYKMDRSRAQIGNTRGQQKAGALPRKDLAALAQRLKAKQSTASGHARSLVPPSQRPASSSKALPALNRLANKQGGSKIPAKTENVLKHLKTLRKMADEKKAGHIQEGNEAKVNNENKIQAAPVVNLKHETDIPKSERKPSIDVEKHDGNRGESEKEEEVRKTTAEVTNTVNKLRIDNTSQHSEEVNTKGENGNEESFDRGKSSNQPKNLEGEIGPIYSEKRYSEAKNVNIKDENTSQRSEGENVKDARDDKSKFVSEKSLTPAKNVQDTFENSTTKEIAKMDTPDGVLSAKDKNTTMINPVFAKNLLADFSEKVNTTDEEVSDSLVAEWEAELENMKNFCSSVQSEFREMSIKLQNLGSEVRILNWQRRAQLACETVTG